LNKCDDYDKKFSETENKLAGISDEIETLKKKIK